MSGQVTNALTVDVEGFVESNEESVAIPSRYFDRAQEKREIEENVEATLDLFARCNLRGTFFYLGTVARDLPHLVRRTADMGHEIGSHSDSHRRIFGLRPETFREGMRASKALLEDLAGRPVLGFRAPDFSITRDSLWALDVLADLGFRYDSSIYPIGLHDVYGIDSAQRFAYRLSDDLIELPLSTVEVGGRRLPFGGGGYFRLYPLALTRLLFSRLNRQGHPAVLYIHPYEVGPVVPRIAEMPALRTFRHYYHTSGGGVRLEKVLRSFRFAPAIDVLREAGLC